LNENQSSRDSCLSETGRRFSPPTAMPTRAVLFGTVRGKQLGDRPAGGVRTGGFRLGSPSAGARTGGRESRSGWNRRDGPRHRFVGAAPVPAAPVERVIVVVGSWLG
jgi:hypothetical protein